VEFGRRLRVLFVFGAFVLCASVCFIYAEDLPSAPPVISAAAPDCDVPSPAHHLLLWAGPQHASFLAPAADVRIVEPPAPKAPVATAAVLTELESAAHRRHHLFGRARARSHAAQPAPSMNESSILELLLHRQLMSNAAIVTTQAQ
jgi:hypothetical protein